jgi:hypothetical protein
MTLAMHSHDHAFSGPATHKPDVQRFLDRLCRALTHGDTAKIVSCWDVPAYVLSDDGTHAVSSTEEIAQFFGAAKDQYNVRGVTDTRAIIERQQWLTDDIVTVDVRWPWLGANGEDLGEERSTYVLRIDEHGHLRLHVAIMRGAEER